MTKQHFQLDRKTAISAIVAVSTIIFTLIAKTWSGGYIASQVVARLDNQDREIAELKDHAKETDKTLELRGQWGEQQASRLSVVENNISNMKDSINDIKGFVVRIDDNMKKIANRIR